MAKMYWKIKDETGKWKWVSQMAPFPINPDVIAQCHCAVCANGIIDETMTEEEE